MLHKFSSVSVGFPACVFGSNQAHDCSGVTMDENGAILRTCIDGKQRLSSICAYVWSPFDYSYAYQTCSFFDGLVRLLSLTFFTTLSLSLFLCMTTDIP